MRDQRDRDTRSDRHLAKLRAYEDALEQAKRLRDRVGLTDPRQKTLPRFGEWAISATPEPPPPPRWITEAEMEEMRLHEHLTSRELSDLGDSALPEMMRTQSPPRAEPRPRANSVAAQGVARFSPFFSTTLLGELQQHTPVRPIGTAFARVGQCEEQGGGFLRSLSSPTMCNIMSIVEWGGGRGRRRGGRERSYHSASRLRILSACSCIPNVPAPFSLVSLQKMMRRSGIPAPSPSLPSPTQHSSTVHPAGAGTLPAVSRSLTVPRGGAFSTSPPDVTVLPHSGGAMPGGSIELRTTRLRDVIAAARRGLILRAPPSTLSGMSSALRFGPLADECISP